MSLKDYILAVSGFFGNGNPFSFGRKCHKDVAGYDIKSLLIGSEGTLGIITSITLKLIPRPRFSQSFWCSFSSLQSICQFFQTLFLLIFCFFLSSLNEAPESEPTALEWKPDIRPTKHHRVRLSGNLLGRHQAKHTAPKSRART